MNHTRANNKFLCPCCDALRPALVGDVSVSAGVSGLQGHGNPNAILRAVRAVVIPSLNGETGSHASSHVCLKVGEVLPPIADLDAPATVVVEHASLGVFASRLHSAPCAIQAGLPSGPAISSTVAGIEGYQVLPSVGASAGHTIALNQTVPVREGYFPAITLALPSGLLSRPFYRSHGNQLAKPFARHVLKTVSPFSRFLRLIHGGNYAPKSVSFPQETALALPSAPLSDG